MSTPPDRVSRIAGRVNLDLLDTKLVVVVGAGSVGSQVAEELANCVGRLRLFDGKQLEEHHLPRHALTKAYVGMNKAVGMESYLAREVPTLQVEAKPWHIDSSFSDNVLDGYLHDADLIVVATDNREVQRTIGRRALALDIPAVFPGLYARDGGEVFVQFSPERPCFFCRDHFRPANQELRGVTATNPDILTIIALTSRLCFGVLDQRSDYQRLLAPSRGERWPPQLFVHNELVLGKHLIPWHDGCSSCEVGPSSLRQEASEAWQRAERERTSSPLRTSPHSVPPTTSTILPRRQTAPPVARSTTLPSGPGFVSMVFLKVSAFILALAFTAAPIGVMHFVEPARIAHKGNILLGLVSIGCGFWFVGGLVAIGCSFVYLFRAWD